MRSASPATDAPGVRLGRLLRHGGAAGASAGLAAAVVMWLHTEPVIRRAIAVEEARAHEHGHAEQELVSRGAQVLAGTVTAALVGVLVGLVFAVVFARTRDRLPGRDDLSRTLCLAALGFGAFTLLPALAVPAAPPGVGDPATVGRRTSAYLLAVVVGLLVVGAASGLDRVLRARGVAPPTRLAAVLAAVAVVVPLSLWALPTPPDAVPPDVPAELLWDFRLASLGQLGTMWLVLALVFGLLVTRRSTPVRDAEPALSA